MEKMMNFTLELVSQEGFFKEKRMCGQHQESASQATENAEAASSNVEGGTVEIAQLPKEIEAEKEKMLVKATGTDRDSAEIRQALEVRFAALKAEADQLNNEQQQDQQHVAQEIQTELERLTGITLTTEKVIRRGTDHPQEVRVQTAIPAKNKDIYATVPQTLQECFDLLDKSDINWPGIGTANDVSPQETQIKTKLLILAQDPVVQKFLSENPNNENPFTTAIQRWIDSYKDKDRHSAMWDNSWVQNHVNGLIWTLEQVSEKIKKEHPIVEPPKEILLAATKGEAGSRQEKKAITQPTYEENWNKGTMIDKQASPSSAKVVVKTSLNVRDDNGARKAGLKNDTVVTIMDEAKKMVEGYETGSSEQKARKFVKIQYEQDAKKQEGWVAEDYLTPITEEESQILKQSTVEEPKNTGSQSRNATAIPRQPEPRANDQVVIQSDGDAPQANGQKSVGIRAQKETAPKPLEEIIQQRLEGAMKKMPNAIVLEALGSQRPSGNILEAKGQLHKEITRIIQQALDVNGLYNTNYALAWASGKVDSLGQEAIIKGTSIPISPAEQEKLLQDFIQANQQIIQMGSTNSTPHIPMDRHEIPA